MILYVARFSDKLDDHLVYLDEAGEIMPIETAGYTQIGAFDAKTRLSEILRKVEQGERFTITVRGKAVADVVPAQARLPKRSPEEVEAAYQRLRNPKIQGPSHEVIRSWIEEGRP
ncbi:MAG: type II toxin-antitoxin system Phd/YefM family antitoxin [Terracidiphilus sp.]